MAAEYQELVSKIVVQIQQAKAALAEIEKAAGQATQKVEGIGSKGNNAFKSLGGALKRLAGTFGVVLTAGAVVSFIKRVGESTRQVGLLAARSGQAEKSVRALQNQFKALGYSEAEANSTLENFTQSFANFAFKGEIGGLAQSFLSLGVNIVDVNGKMKDMNDLLIEAGDASLSISGGDRVKAQQLMLSMGFSAAQADLATRADRRERMEQMKREAVASRESAQKAEKLAGALNTLQTKLVDLVLKTDESFGIFDKARKAAETSGHVLEGFALIITRIGDVCSSAGGIIKEAFKPVMGLLEELGGHVDKAAKEGKLPWWAKWLNESAEGMNTDWQSNDLPETGGNRNPVSVKEPGNNPPVGENATDDEIKQHLAERVKKAEGLRLDAYQDSDGVWTIGYGHTKGVKPGMRITQQEAEALLKQDIDAHADPALKLYAGHSARTKYLAADLTYNAGLKHVQEGSRFNRLAQNGEIQREDYGKLVNYAGGKYLPGLRNRRLATYDASMAFYPRVTPYIPAKDGAGVAQAGGDTTQNTITNNINIYAPSNDAGDIAREAAKYTGRISTYVSPMA
ncbi:MAG: glycoside hydrolase family protein [Oxalobacter formigenes]|nr:glycoside hydrolase family protein [Oxalobacter formigenes]